MSPASDVCPELPLDIWQHITSFISTKEWACGAAMSCKAFTGLQLRKLHVDLAMFYLGRFSNCKRKARTEALAAAAEWALKHAVEGKEIVLTNGHQAICSVTCKESDALLHFLRNCFNTMKEHFSRIGDWEYAALHGPWAYVGRKLVLQCIKDSLSGGSPKNKCSLTFLAGCCHKLPALIENVWQHQHWCPRCFGL